MSGEATTETWEDIVVRVLKENQVSLITYVPDNVLARLIRLLQADPYFTLVSPAREEEAVAIVTGAYMGGKRGIALMQTSGFATIVNALASLACPFQIPLLLMISERGTLGEFQQGQAIVCRTMRPVLRRPRHRAFRHPGNGPGRVHRRRHGQAGLRHPGAGRDDPVSAPDQARRVGEEHAMSNIEPNVDRNTAKLMNRTVLTRRFVAKLKSEEAVVAGIGNTNFDLWASGQRPQNFYMLGSMGLATPIALGVALAQPQRKVFALDGDGSILMQLGTFGTVASAAQKNLAIIIWDNGAYQITGGQNTLTSTTTDLVALARGAGLAQSAWAADEEHFDALVDRALEGDGPWLIVAKIDGEKPAGTTERDPVKIRLNFMSGLGSKAD